MLKAMNYKIVKYSLFIFLVALLVRLVYALLFVELEYLFTEDQTLYVNLAKQFSKSGFLGISLERMPGYPLFLSFIHAIFGKDMWNVIIIQMLLDSVSCVVIALIAKSLFIRGFWIAGGLSVFNLNMIILSASLLADTLFLFLFVLFLFSLVRYLQSAHVGWLLLLVLFISMSTLVRASSYYLLPILLVILLGWRLLNKDNVFKICVILILYLIVIAVSLGGIHKRNYQQYNSVSLVSQTGKHMIGWVVPATYQYSGQGSYQEGQLLAREKLNLSLQSDNLSILPDDPFERSAYQTNVGKQVLLEFGFINILKAWAVGSVVNLLAPSVAFSPALRSMDHPSFYGTKGDGIVDKIFNYIKNSNGFFYLSILMIGTVISIVFTILAIAGALKMVFEFKTVIVATLLILVGYFLAITGPVVGVKYRLPIEPILILFETYFINEYFSKIRKNPY